MNYLRNTLFLTLCLLLFGCPDKKEEVLDLRSESEHFIIVSTSDKTNVQEIQEGLTIAETFFSRIASIVGPDRTPTKKITIIFEGDFASQGPYFDPEGIHLYKYSPQENGYWALIAHEMVHAFREAYYIEYDPYNWPVFGFYDEGFAEYIAQMIDSTKTGFPFYGFPEEVVVGYFVKNNLDIPIDTLRKNHEALNQPCLFQSYTQRASWFRYIEETYGIKAVFSIAYATQEPVNSYLDSITGISTAQLDLNWRAWAKNKYVAFPNAASLTDQYLERIPPHNHCIAGEDY